MGASLSNLTGGEPGADSGPSLGDIPESCVASVYMHLTPPEIFNLARLIRAFRGAASADSVWESKLSPASTYQYLLDKLPPDRQPVRCPLNKKDIPAISQLPNFCSRGGGALPAAAAPNPSPMASTTAVAAGGGGFATISGRRSLICPCSLGTFQTSKIISTSVSVASSSRTSLQEKVSGISENPLVIISFCKFVDFSDHADMRKQLKDLCEEEVRNL